MFKDLTTYEQDSPYDSDEASLIRLTRRNYDLASKVPAEFEVRFSLLQTECYQERIIQFLRGIDIQGEILVP